MNHFSDKLQQTKYKPYPKYKESGVELLGKIPEGWSVKKLRNLGQFTASGIDKKTVKGEPLVKIINFVDVFNSKTKLLKEKDYMLVSATPEKIKAHSVNKGDLIFTPSSETADEIGLSALVDEDLINTAYSYHVLRLRFNTNINHLYKKYLTNNTFVFNQFSILARGTTRQTLGRDDFKSIIIGLPPLQEQKIIANYLDKATEKIDTLIQKQERLIELLKEKRQALISHAVTKGLNPDVKMKDSGVEWLGEIPEHWTICKIKYYGIYKSGDFISAESIEKAGKYPVIGGNGLRGYTDNFNLEGNYVIIGRQGALCGNINYSQGKFWATEHAIVVHNKKTINVKWLGVMLSTMNLNQYSVSAAQPGLAVENIINLISILPPLNEQKDIAKYLDDKTTQIDTLITKATKAIELLKERRTALISAVVTGKIDVREFNE